MEEKLVCVIERDTKELNNHLKDGWTIKEISSCGNYSIHCCYVHLIKENHEN